MELTKVALSPIWLVAAVSLLLLADVAHALANSTSAPYSNSTLSLHNSTVTTTSPHASITPFLTSTKPFYDPWSAVTNRTLASYCYSVSKQNALDHPPQYTTITHINTWYQTLGTMITSYPTSRWYTWTLDFTTSSSLQTWMYYSWSPTLTVPTTTNTYTEAKWISSSWWYPSSPCCGPCTIYAQNTMQFGAKLLFWPTPAPPDFPSTLVNNHNFTFISPSPYIAFVSLYAWDLCGKVGRTDLNYKTMPYAPDEISTYIDYQGTSTAEASARIFNFADISGNCSTIKSLYGSAVKYNPCFPMIKLPERIKDLDPLWKTCELQKWGADDPPIALIQQSVLMPTTSALPVPTVKPTAEPVQISSVVNGVTATPWPPPQTQTSAGGGGWVDPPLSNTADPADPASQGGDPAQPTRSLPWKGGDPPPPAPTPTVIAVDPSHSLTLTLPRAGQGQGMTISIAPGKSITLTPGAAGTVMPLPVNNNDNNDNNDPTDPTDPPPPNGAVVSSGNSGDPPTGGSGPDIFVSLGSSALVIGSSTYSLPSPPTAVTLAPGIVLTLPTLAPGDPSQGGAGTAGYVIQVGPHSSLTLTPGGKGAVVGGMTVSMAPSGGGLVVAGNSMTTTIALPTGSTRGLGGAIWTGLGGGAGVGGSGSGGGSLGGGSVATGAVGKESGARRRGLGRALVWVVGVVVGLGVWL